MTSNAQIDKLGDRLRNLSIVDHDLRLLDEYRRSFAEAYETVVTVTRDQLRLGPTGRPAKSTTSIVAKLQRESIRLSQVQDITGCRIVVPDVIEQDRVVQSLVNAFPAADVVDRRLTPQFGYRAVHVIVRVVGKLVEIQVRSRLQHSWAEASEKCSDVVDPAVKYGGGPESTRNRLLTLSELIAQYEEAEIQLHGLPREIRTSEQVRAIENVLAYVKRRIDELVVTSILELGTSEGPPR